MDSHYISLGNHHFYLPGLIGYDFEKFKAQYKGKVTFDLAEGWEKIKQAMIKAGFDMQNEGIEPKKAKKK